MNLRPHHCYSVADLGAAVREAREAAGHSQAEAADIASTDSGGRVDRAHVSYAERGSATHIRALRALVAAYLKDEAGHPYILVEAPFYKLEQP